MFVVILSEAKDLLLALRSTATKGLGRWVLLLTGLAVCGILVLTCHRDASAPLPAPVAQRVEQHRIQSAVDSADIDRLTRSATAQKVRQESEVVHARQAADSGNFRAAYVLEDSALAAIDRQASLLDLALTRSESHGRDADSVIAELLPLVESREPPCRVIWVVPCPTRRTVAVVAALVTAGVVVVAPRVGRP